jgi:hypothetical protein
MDIASLVAQVKHYDEYLSSNFDLYDIYNGNLLGYIEKELEAQLSPQSYMQAQFRIPPINILKRIMDKLSKVYAHPPRRVVVGGSAQEIELFEWYALNFKINQTMTLCNAYFNLTKRALIEPFLYKPDELTPGTPKLRVIPSHRVIVISYDKADPTVMSLVVTYEGKYQATPTGQPRRYFKAIDKNRFIYFDEDKRDLTPMFAPDTNPGGINVYGAVPYVYLNRSPDSTMPIQDTDTKRMSILIPTLLADTNYASMFQAFSILYGIDVNDEGLKMAPNAFWTFKSNQGLESRPQIGSIKPEMDVDGSLNLIASQLAFWLNSRGIRPGAIGDINGTNFSSGISKMIDEADTAEDRKEQVPYFKYAEQELWDLVLHKMHPVWSESGMIENRTFFRPTTTVEVTFPEQLSMQKRSELVKEVIEEMKAGLTDRKRAIKRINPDMSEEEIDQLLLDVSNTNEVIETNGMDENEDRTT